MSNFKTATPTSSYSIFSQKSPSIALSYSFSIIHRIHALWKFNTQIINTYHYLQPKNRKFFLVDWLAKHLIDQSKFLRGCSLTLLTIRKLTDAAHRSLKIYHLSQEIIHNKFKMNELPKNFPTLNGIIFRSRLGPDEKILIQKIGSLFKRTLLLLKEIFILSMTLLDIVEIMTTYNKSDEKSKLIQKQWTDEAASHFALNSSSIVDDLTHLVEEIRPMRHHLQSICKYLHIDLDPTAEAKAITSSLLGIRHRLQQVGSFLSVPLS